jgi:hypothetical protein
MLSALYSANGLGHRRRPSYCFPGSLANFATAVAPAPGFFFVNQMLFYSGKAEMAVLKL